MKKIFIIVISSLLLTACSKEFVNTTKNEKEDKPLEKSTQAYVPGTEDVPVYEGFEEVPNSTVSYDTTDGSIISAEFFSRKSSIEDVNSFYKETLPQLGWNKINSQEYQRDGETLKLNIGQSDKKIILKFNIRPIRPTMPFS